MVSMIFRARLSSFLAGFAVASGFAVYQLRNDVRESHALLAEQVRNSISNSRPRSQTPTDALCVSDPYRSLLHPRLSLSLSLSVRARKPGGRRAEEASEARGPGRETGVRVPVEQRAVGLGAPRVFWRRPIHNNKRIFFFFFVVVVFLVLRPRRAAFPLGQEPPRPPLARPLGLDLG